MADDPVGRFVEIAVDERRRDYVVEVRPDVLLEVDGPMLKHGIQDVHGWTLELPKRVSERPDQDLLDQRWRVFSA